MRFTLKQKVNTAIFAAFVLIAVIFTFVQVELQQKRLKTTMDRVETILKTLVERDKEPLANEIFESRVRAIRIRVGEMLKVKGILNISIYSNSGKLLISEGKHPSTTGLSDKDLKATMRGIQMQKELWYGESTISFLQGISVIEERIGFVRIHYSLADMEYEQFLFFVTIAGLLVSILFVMVMIINLILSKTIIRPITDLRDTMLKIEASGPGLQAPVTSRDEIGDLTGTFNSMSSELAESYSEIKTQREELRQTKNLLDNIINSMPSILVSVDTNEKIIEWNREAEKRAGIPISEARGRLFSEVLPDLAQETDNIRIAIESRTPQKDLKIEIKIEDKTCFMDVTVYPLIINGVEGAVIRVDDVTERVRIEEMIIQTEKMMSVGGLAAGMAHEINNPLSGILQGAQNVLRRTSPELEQNVQAARKCGTDLATVRTYLEERGIFQFLESIRQSGVRASRIVTNMLQFSRPGKSQKAPVSLPELIDRTVELAASDYDIKKRFDFKHIEIVREYDPDLPKVSCVETEISQVLLNLLKNAAESMAQSAKRKAPGPMRQAPRIILRARRDGAMARIEVEDNGPGMDEAVRKRILEPFFTTKDVGSGTGLGLSVSYFIITENHDGTMELMSSPGRGTKFIVRLPVERKTA